MEFLTFSSNIECFLSYGINDFAHSHISSRSSFKKDVRTNTYAIYAWKSEFEVVSETIDALNFLVVSIRLTSTRNADFHLNAFIFKSIAMRGNMQKKKTTKVYLYRSKLIECAFLWHGHWTHTHTHKELPFPLLVNFIGIIFFLPCWYGISQAHQDQSYFICMLCA